MITSEEFLASAQLSPSKFREIEGLLEDEFCNDEGEMESTQEEEREFLLEKGYDLPIITAFFNAY